jgi:tetratricopeptide (TPR) repeat protein
MDPERWQRVKSLFEAALAREPSERAAFLAGAAPELADEVLRLLASDAGAGSFLSGPAEAPVAIAAGRRIGPYRVVGEIGHGGMGAVLRAVRDDDQYRKEVAIKLVHGGVGPAVVMERFKAERQILANLEHPNIARMLDGGATEEGWPWFAMEFVEGTTIDAYCAPLSIPQRLELFRQVCSAVQYAHQRLVIHRDLKPANILVTTDGVPKLLDFGIAKLVGGDQAGTTLTTFPLMTPEYASPEQVKGEAITTSSDIYSLGMLLYELLAGRRAYELPGRSPQEIARVVCEMDPPPPSTAGSRQLRGDLDNIVLKAIRKETARRYYSVSELSEDIRRHLAGAPVLARADTIGYRLSKFVSRHRAGVAAAALVLVSLVAGLAIAVRQARIAQARFDDVRKLANWVVFDMDDAIAKLPGSTPARKELVAKATEYLDGLAAQSAGDRSLQQEIVRSYLRLGQIQGGTTVANVGDKAGAIASYIKAISIAERLGNDRATTLQLAQAGVYLSYELSGAEQRNQILKTKATLDRIPPGDGDADVVLAWINWLSAKGGYEADVMDLPALRETRRQQLELQQRWQALRPNDDRRDLALVYKQYGAVLQAMNDYDAAGPLFEKALEIDKKAAEAEPQNPQRQLDLSFTYASIGSLLNAKDDYGGSVAAYRRAVELRAAVYAADQKNEFAFGALVKGLSNLADALADGGDLESALEKDREVLDLRQKHEKDHPSKRGSAEWEASYHWSIGKQRTWVAPRRGRDEWRRAREEYEKALAIWNGLQDDGGNRGKLQQAIAKCDSEISRVAR